MRERVDVIQQRGQTQTLGRCSQDKASVHGSHTPPTQLPGCPTSVSLTDGSRVNRLLLGWILSFSILWALSRHLTSLMLLMLWDSMNSVNRRELSTQPWGTEVLSTNVEEVQLQIHSNGGMLLHFPIIYMGEPVLNVGLKSTNGNLM